MLKHFQLSEEISDWTIIDHGDVPYDFLATDIQCAKLINKLRDAAVKKNTTWNATEIDKRITDPNARDAEATWDRYVELANDLEKLEELA